MIFSMSNYEHICYMVPPDFDLLLLEKPEPSFKYMMDNSCMISDCIFVGRMFMKKCVNFSALPGQFLSNTLISMINNTRPEDIIELFKKPLRLENGEIKADVLNLTKIDAFIQTILFTANMSLNHAFAAITKFISVFKVCFLRKIY